MAVRDPRRFVPGASVLGGAAAGLTYEGCLHDAMAREERQRRREAGHSRAAPHPSRPPRRAAETARLDEPQPV